MAASIDPKMACRRHHIEELLDLLSTQFLEMVPIRKMKWKDEETAALVATPELQQRVLHATVLNPVCRLHPPALSYRTHFMKHLIQKLEQLDAEICDEAYETYTDLLSQREDEDDTLCYKTYTLPSGDRITLQESVNLVSQGTTGLSTWQAAQHLAEWLVENPDVLRDKRVVELGCGLGLTGVVVCRACKIKSYTFTDCHSQVLFLLAKNIEINLSKPSTLSSTQHTGLPDPRDKKMFRKIKRQLSLTTDNKAELSCVTTASGDHCMEQGEDAGGPEVQMVLSPDTPNNNICFEESREEEEVECDTICVSEADGDMHGTLMDAGLEVNEAHWEVDKRRHAVVLRADPRVTVCQLNWEKVSLQALGSLQGNIILGADVVYDPSIIPCLVRLLRQLLEPERNSRAFIASTVRNEDTRDAFLIALSSEGLSYSVVEGPKQTLFHYDRMVPIEILQISYQ